MAILAWGGSQGPLQAEPQRVTDAQLRSMDAAPAKTPAKAVGEATADSKERIVKQEVTGEVVATTKRNLSLEISRTGGHIEEMLLPVDPAAVKLDRITSMSDLQRGDRVRVEYRQRFRKAEDGEERLAWTEATKISLMSRGMGGQQRLLRSSPEGGGR
jgi:hypothetical protein